MKIRSDYVSNSSSSSFIVIVNNGVDMTQAISVGFIRYQNEWDAYAIPNKSAKHAFGWEWEDTSSFEGKLNFIGIQLLYLFIEKITNKKSPWKKEYTGKDFDRLYDMLKKVCLEKFHFHVKLDEDVIKTRVFHNDEKGYYAFYDLENNFYIDHQSSAEEGECMEMFQSEDALYDFLRFEESYIRGGNDNG